VNFKKLLLSISIISVTMVTSCDDGVKNEVLMPNETIPPEVFKDEVTIGKQVWMTKNLDVEIFRNGDTILEAKTSEEWINAGKNNLPAWCYYDMDKQNRKIYGKLYNWYAVNDQRGLAPKGWHVPVDDEWNYLIEYLGGDGTAGNKIKSTHLWEENGNGTNESGFYGFPGGFRDYFGLIDGMGRVGGWWSSTKSKNEFATRFDISYGVGSSLNSSLSSKVLGLSVRCVKD
jgi:uncharacterized protein (TIGR02145 family)